MGPVHAYCIDPVIVARPAPASPDLRPAAAGYRERAAVNRGMAFDHDLE
jgi:hypothetical protein